MLKLGTTDINELFLGETQINEAYLGETLVYQSGFHPTYQKILDVSTANGYALPSAAVQAIHNNLCKTLVNNGLIEVHDVFRMFAGDVDSGYALLNWGRFSAADIIADTGFTTNLITKAGGISFTTKKGYKGDGVAGTALDHNWSVTTHRRRSDHGDVMLWAIMFDVATKTSGWASHGTVNNTNASIQFRAGGTDLSIVSLEYGASTNNDTAPGGYNITDFLFHSLRSDATNTKVFENGTQIATRATVVENTANDANELGSFRVATVSRAHGIAAMGVCTRISDAQATILQNALQTAINQILALP